MVAEASLLFAGPSEELLLVPIFFELSVLLPQVTLHIHMIGPEVPDELHNTETHYTIKGCQVQPPIDKQCVHDQQLVVTFWQGCYHDVLATWANEGGEGKFGPPVLVFAPDAGIPVYPSWRPTLELLQSARMAATAGRSSSSHMVHCTGQHCSNPPRSGQSSSSHGPTVQGSQSQPDSDSQRELDVADGQLATVLSIGFTNPAVPAVWFTDYCEEACIRSQAVIEAICEHQMHSLVAALQLNPFRNLCARLDHGTALPACSNAFLFGWC